jgi:hypothetical protein
MFDSLARYLLTANPANLLAALTSGNNTFAVAARDGIDSTARVAGELRRGHDGTREAAISEFAGFLFWGFGVKVIGDTFNAIAKKLNIQFPELNAFMLFKKGHLFELTPEKIRQYTLTGSEYSQQLTKVLGDKNLYFRTNLMRLLLTGLIPVTLISLAVPKLINQPLTRYLLAEKHKRKTLLEQSLTQKTKGLMGERQLASVQPFENFQYTPPTSLAGTLPTYPSYNYSFNPSPWGYNNYAYTGNTGFIPKQPMYSGPNFGFIGTAVGNMLANPKTTMLGAIDVPLGLSRVFSSRSMPEALEEFITNANITLALFYVADALTSAMHHVFSRNNHSVAGMSPKAMHIVNTRFANTPKLLQDQTKSAFQQLGVEDAKALSQMKPEQLVEKVLAYFNPNHQQVGSKNFLLELAKDIDLVGLHDYGKGVQGIDLTQTLDLKKITALGHHLEGLSTHLGKNAAAGAMTQFLKKSVLYSFAAFAIANILGVLQVGVLGPILKQTVTRFLTGSIDHPGITEADKSVKKQVVKTEEAAVKPIVSSIQTVPSKPFQQPLYYPYPVTNRYAYRGAYS